MKKFVPPRKLTPLTESSSATTVVTTGITKINHPYTTSVTPSSPLEIVARDLTQTKDILSDITSSIRNNVREDPLSTVVSTPLNGAKKYFNVLYTKTSNKKHKTYEDGILIMDGKQLTLLNMEGKQVTRELNPRLASSKFAPDDTFQMNYYDIEVSSTLTEKDYTSGRIFLNSTPTVDATPQRSNYEPEESSSSMHASNFHRTVTSISSLSSDTIPSSSTGLRPIQGSHHNISFNNRTVVPKPRYDPYSPSALVLQWPLPDTKSSHVPVVVDPFLTNLLREHQKEGLKFLWECINGLRIPNHYGGILADEMGLGKTLQTISLIWIALKQSSINGTIPLIQKAVIVCPSSLVSNWRNEFKLWLGDERCRPLAVTRTGKEAEAIVQDFVIGSSNVHPVLILSYELFRKYGPIIATETQRNRIGLLVCDEGHRLKSSTGNKTIDALASVPTKRRILLTGTPIQNNLEEYYAMANFVCPDYLGSLPVFKRNFAVPITQSRDKFASPAQIELGLQRTQELFSRVSHFVLRRTSDILNQYLPPKTESLIFLRLTPLQITLYRNLMLAYTRISNASNRFDRSNPQVLVVLNLLRKVCVHPDLVYDALQEDGITTTINSTVLTLGIGSRKRFKHLETVAANSTEIGPLCVDGNEENSSADTDEAFDDDNDGQGTGNDETVDTVDGIISDETSDIIIALSDNEDTTDTELSSSIVNTDDEIDNDDVKGNDYDPEEEDGVINLSSIKKSSRKKSVSSKRGFKGSTENEYKVTGNTRTELRSAITSSFPEGYVPFNDMWNNNTGGGRNGGSVPSCLPDAAITTMLTCSSKLTFLDNLLRSVRTLHPNDRFVIASNYGQTLDRVQDLLRYRKYNFVRLDGSTPSAVRGDMVTQFNTSYSSTLVFLLSAQAGGVGLNLVGANRLIMLDASWNPAVDKQCLARIWRDGQTKPVFIYRLFSSWSIEEKILQRQLMKNDMAQAVQQSPLNTVVASDALSSSSSSSTHHHHSSNSNNNNVRLSRTELQELFTIDPDGGNKLLKIIPTTNIFINHGKGIVPFGCDTYRIMNQRNTESLSKSVTNSASLTVLTSTPSSTTSSSSSSGGSSNSPYTAEPWSEYNGNTNNIASIDEALSNSIAASVINTQEGNRSSTQSIPSVTYVYSSFFNHPPSPNPVGGTTHRDAAESL